MLRFMTTDYNSPLSSSDVFLPVLFCVGKLNRPLHVLLAFPVNVQVSPGGGYPYPAALAACWLEVADHLPLLLYLLLKLPLLLFFSITAAI